MSNLAAAAEAVAPFIFYIAFGYLVRFRGIADKDFMQRLNQMVFRVFFPFMMFYNLYQKENARNFNGRLLAVCVGSLFILLLLLFITVPKIVKDNPRRGVVIQGIYRSNYVLFAVPLAENLFGKEGAASASLLVAVIVPLYNVAAVVILEYFRGGSIHFLPLLKRVLQNPLIAGALTGMLFLFFQIELPAAIVQPVARFSDMTTPLALFVLGGTLDLTSLKADLKYLVPVLGIKMIILPAAAAALSVLFGFTGMERFLYLIMFAAPVAASSYPMAQNMGGDGELAGELVAVSTGISAVTIFLWIYLLKEIRLL